VREAKNPEDVVRARLRTVVAGPGAPTDFSDTSPLSWTDIVPSWPEPELDELAPPAPASSAPADPTADNPEESGKPRYPWDAPDRLEPGSLALESMGLEALPAPADPTRRRPGEGGTGSTAAELGMPEWTYADDSAVTGEGAFGSAGRDGSMLTRLLPFDPGRRGVKALAAVAVVVVLIAAFLAWHARPKVDPVAESPFPAGTDGGTISGTIGGTGPSPRASSGGEVVVAVGGKVRKPGLVHLPPGSRVADALQAAGGAAPGTDVTALNLARKVVDGELIMVGAAVPVGGSGGATSTAPGGPLNLNTATLADLDKLPGVGPVLAQRILDARGAQGGFRSVSDLRKVSGIGDSRYEQLKDLVTV
jgi:competence protein ComEA